jgi:hypothetical protein
MNSRLRARLLRCLCGHGHAGAVDRAVEHVRARLRRQRQRFPAGDQAGALADRGGWRCKTPRLAEPADPLPTGLLPPLQALPGILNPGQDGYDDTSEPASGESADAEDLFEASMMHKTSRSPDPPRSFPAGRTMGRSGTTGTTARRESRLPGPEPVGAA